MTTKNNREQNEYDLMLLLERLESLHEDMLELGVSDIAEVERRIQEMHARLDGLPSDEDALQ